MRVHEYISFHYKSLRFTMLVSILVLFSESAKDDIPPDFIYLASLSITISFALATTRNITMFSYSSALREQATVVTTSDHDKAPEHMFLRLNSIKSFKSMAITGANMICRFFTGQQSLTPSRTDKSSHDCDEQIKDEYIQTLEENRALLQSIVTEITTQAEEDIEQLQDEILELKKKLDWKDSLPEEERGKVRKMPLLFNRKLIV